MKSLREFFQIGVGPSSSHTMGPQRAARLFLARNPDLQSVQVTLFGSLGATGHGHLTDVAIQTALEPRPVTFVWKPEQYLPGHPNGMEFEGVGADGRVIPVWRVYSVGGAALREEQTDTPESTPQVYARRSIASLLSWTRENGEPLWRYVELCEDREIWEYLGAVWKAMSEALQRGMHAEGVLPGSLRLARKSRSYALKARRNRDPFQRTGLVAAYALAVAEENASGGIVVTAPTCGSAGVLPAILYYLQETLQAPEVEVLRALATAGLIGNLVKTNASISGAEVGCQGEIGTACAMAGAAAAQMLGGTPQQIEYAAEMGLEHHLGLTCDPVAGLVQIPCIERNALACTRALDCAEYALLSDGTHRVSLDQVIATMKQTGHDLQSAYRETALGGLALFLR